MRKFFTNWYGKIFLFLSGMLLRDVISETLNKKPKEQGNVSKHIVKLYYYVQDDELVYASIGAPITKPETFFGNYILDRFKRDENCQKILIYVKDYETIFEVEKLHGKR
jgi:hypothetical protein